jgi:hypothetical protein
MVTIRIPQEQLSGFRKLVALDSESVRNIAAALKEDFPGLGDSDALTHKVSGAADIPSPDAREIVQVLTSLYMLRARREALVPEFVQDAIEALDESGNEELKLSEEERIQFKEKLAELLSVEEFSTESKAVDVQFENDRTFYGARIVTDVRPLFGPDPEEPPTGAVIIHMLKITYRERNRTKDLFVSLDTDDLDTLTKAIERANSKTENLKSFLSASGLPYIRLDGE